jgi:glyoxylase I family protein
MGEGDAPVVVNHVGLAVSDRDRAQRFYVECLGFEYVGSLRPDNDATGKLLEVDDPNLVARYLRRGSFVLELLEFDAKTQGRKNERAFVDYGLTHLSFRVPDVRAVLARVRTYGGTVLDDTAIVAPIVGADVIIGIVVLDPDGQRLELLQFYEGPPAGPAPPL